MSYLQGTLCVEGIGGREENKMPTCARPVARSAKVSSSLRSSGSLSLVP